MPLLIIRGGVAKTSGAQQAGTQQKRGYANREQSDQHTTGEEEKPNPRRVDGSQLIFSLVLSPGS
jgi:hypothetical protein